MKRNLLLAILLNIFTVFLTFAPVFAVDLVGYMGLNVGKWAVWKDDTSDLFGVVVRKDASGQIIRDWYINKGSGWLFNTTEIWKITTEALILVGMNDGKDKWLTTPQLSIPRSWSLNEPFFYKGVLKNERTSATKRMTHVFSVTKTNMDNVITPAGIFENCIKYRGYNYLSGESSDTVDLMCPGRFVVKKWKNKIKDTSAPQDEGQSTSIRELIDFGNSNPPLP